MQGIWTRSGIYRRLGLSLFATAPAFLFLVYVYTRSLVVARVRGVIIALAVLAPLSPLLLHFVASDTDRWNTLVITNSLLMLSIAFSHDRRIVERVSRENQACGKAPELTARWAVPAMVLLVFLSAVSSVSLLDGLVIQGFPFRQHQNHWLEVFRGTSEVIPYPLK